MGRLTTSNALPITMDGQNGIGERRRDFCVAEAFWCANAAQRIDREWT